MKSRHRGGGHPEEVPGFTDILFGTTGLLVLIMTVTLAQIGIPEVSKETLDEIAANLKATKDALNAIEIKAAVEELKNDQLSISLESSQKTLKKNEREIENLNRKFEQEKKQREEMEYARDQAAKEVNNLKGDLKGHNVDLVIVCDGTMSMKPTLESLRVTVKAVAELGWRLCKKSKFRLGLVIYRARGQHEVFPLTYIGGPINGTPSAGMVALTKFTDSKDIRASLASAGEGDEAGKSTGKFEMCTRMTPLFGHADVEGGVKSGLKMFKGNHSSDVGQVLYILGDIGPWEQGEPKKIEPSDRAIASRVRSSITSFTKKNSRARVLSVFTGKTVEKLPHRRETIKFFKNLSFAAGKQGQYADDVSQMTATAVDNILSQQEGEF